MALGITASLSLSLCSRRCIFLKGLQRSLSGAAAAMLQRCNISSAAAKGLGTSGLAIRIHSGQQETGPRRLSPRGSDYSAGSAREALSSSFRRMKRRREGIGERDERQMVGACTPAFALRQVCKRPAAAGRSEENLQTESLARSLSPSQSFQQEGFTFISFFAAVLFCDGF